MTSSDFAAQCEKCERRFKSEHFYQWHVEFYCQKPLEVEDEEEDNTEDINTTKAVDNSESVNDAQQKLCDDPREDPPPPPEPVPKIRTKEISINLVDVLKDLNLQKQKMLNKPGFHTCIICRGKNSDGSGRRLDFGDNFEALLAHYSLCYYKVLYCTVLYIVYCTVLCIVLYCVLYCIVYCTVLCIVLYCTAGQLLALLLHLSLIHI